MAKEWYAGFSLGTMVPLLRSSAPRCCVNSGCGGFKREHEAGASSEVQMKERRMLLVFLFDAEHNVQCLISDGNIFKG